MTKSLAVLIVTTVVVPLFVQAAGRVIAAAMGVT